MSQNETEVSPESSGVWPLCMVTCRIEINTGESGPTKLSK